MRERAKAKVEALQDAICDALEAADGSAVFRQSLWERDGGGGGRTRVLEGGAVFEKGGVNVSTVFGELPEPLREKLHGDATEFWATGISLVLHPLNPHVPTVHANFRYIERGDVGWFGGGADLTPYVLYDDDARHFHEVLGSVCDRHDPTFYPRFKRWCDEYFWVAHREEARGVGGLFFDYLKPGEAHDGDALFAWWSELGERFTEAYLPIVEARRGVRWTEAQRRWQLQRRGRYVEFNLVHDRGTLFGLQTKGRIESILMSMPPLVRWDYDVQPEPGTPEARLIDVLRHPRAWREGEAKSSPS